MTDQPIVAHAPQGTPAIDVDPHFAYVLRHADDNLVLAQRLGELVSNAPELEEDIAIANTAIDHLGVARVLLTHAGAVEGAGRDEDALAMTRTEREFTNVLLVEQPNGDFAMTMTRALFFDAYQLELWNRLAGSADSTLAAIAAKAHKEARYHVRHSSGWVIRLGDGTDESHHRVQAAVNGLWRFVGEMFVADDVDRAMVDAGIGIDPSALRDRWTAAVRGVLDTATLTMPEEPIVRVGGRSGFHSEHLGHLLSELQWMQRTYPGLEW
jgi:ring-1,2-phenylacetyl-CoA epoxidase subunit PaaC